MFNNNSTIAPPERLYFLKHINYNSDMVYHNKNKGFTLAEVLITLGIIGVVAALTLTSLISKYKEKATVTLVKENYSIFSQALKMVTIDYPDFESLKDSQAIFDEISKHIKKVKSCEIKKGCMSETYTKLDGGTISPWDNFGNIKTGVLANGTTFWILSRLEDTNKYNGQIGFDINGNKKPNKLGVDFFHFSFDINGNIKPHPQGYSCCALHGTNTCGFNGYSCSDWILDHENMDYLKKDISK